MLIAGDWEGEIVEPLRRVRRKLEAHGGAQRLRQQVKDAELAAEWEVQNALEDLARRHLRPASDPDALFRARRALAAYSRAAGVATTAGFSVALLEKVARLTFPRLA
jgi:hypothetical protein